MTPDQKATYGRIFQFEIDDPASLHPFSAKLAEAYGWSQSHTHRVIYEYKRFMFLVAITPHPLSPSAAVDRVWHQHLLYSHAYWEDFCGKAIGRPIHHQLSKGGPAEGIKHYQQYCQTLTLYRHYFGNPPPDIWHFPKLKTESPTCQWIDKKDYWTIRKPHLRSIFQTLRNKSITHHLSFITRPARSPTPPAKSHLGPPTPP